MRFCCNVSWNQTGRLHWWLDLGWICGNSESHHHMFPRFRNRNMVWKGHVFIVEADVKEGYGWDDTPVDILGTYINLVSSPPFQQDPPWWPPGMWWSLSSCRIPVPWTSQCACFDGCEEARRGVWNSQAAIEVTRRFLKVVTYIYILYIYTIYIFYIYILLFLPQHS